MNESCQMTLHTQGCLFLKALFLTIVVMPSSSCGPCLIATSFSSLNTCQFPYSKMKTDGSWIGHLLTV